ncbi:general L-amino acid transport system substrate-binding protein [Bosea sp. OAE752]|uniref:Amino acid ABC transporter substrate-binding protein n=2 Tax=Bosea TaxID=85413 RepID=A0A927HWI6_9HYPH|nr:amino acid ABC transporter substrate-binding protein [Bosea spartocytisi]MBD3844390.1 amino acid ABC transporter substrate-binding protein [Bosea spartocytisi]MCT4470504.1 amino acid ABC transporter substrate-binding protein [Bosea spartocytisi]
MKTITSALLALTLSVAIAPAEAQTTTLATVKSRGDLICGVSPGLAGFGIPDAKGEWAGLDVDLCRAISAAIFNDPKKVKFTPLSSKDRFTALQSGEVDVLSRTSTWTMSRDTTLGLTFAGVNYYDGQAFLVQKKLGIDTARKLDGASICLQQGTTTELNVADYFRKNKIKYEPVTFDKGDEAIKAFESGRCDALTDDSSALYALKLKLVNPAEAVVLPELISKEPLGPVVRSSDLQWFNLVKWTLDAMLNAEELGVTKANVDEMLKSDNPEIRRLLGAEGKFGEGIGLTNDWAYRIVKLVGNYGESFERSVGQGSELKIARGKNALWTEGGLQYAPPVR